MASMCRTVEHSGTLCLSAAQVPRTLLPIWPVSHHPFSSCTSKSKKVRDVAGLAKTSFTLGFKLEFSCSNKRQGMTGQGNQETGLRHTHWGEPDAGCGALPFPGLKRRTQPVGSSKEDPAAVETLLDALMNQWHRGQGRRVVPVGSQAWRREELLKGEEAVARCWAGAGLLPHSAGVRGS